jgi:hypothetical protein
MGYGNPTITLLLTVTAVIFSCKKNGQSPNEGTELIYQENSDESGVVWKRTYARNVSNKLISLRDSSIAGSFEAISLQYGTDGRISRVNNLDASGNIIFYFTFEYNADGMLRKKQAVPGTINLADDYDSYAYDASGRLVADSVYAKSGIPATYKLSSLTTFTYTGDNVTEVFLYSYYTGSQTLEQKRKFEYDNGNNPFKNIELYYPIVSTGNSMELITYASKNNVVKEFSAEYNMSYQLLQSWNYSYNSSNYPWKANSADQVPGQQYGEIEFFYKQ